MLLALSASAEAVRIQFVAIGFEDSISDLAFYNGEEWVNIDIPEATRSREFEYAGPPEIQFTSTPLPQEETPQVIARASVSPEMERPLFIFVKARDSDYPLQYRILAVEDSARDFPAGTYRLFNLTRQELGVVLGSERLVLAKQERKDSAPQLNDKTYFPFQVYTANKESPHKRMFSSRWFYESNVRMLIFLMEDEDRSLVVLKSVFERVASPETEQ